MTKWAGMEGVCRIVREKERELRRRFPPAFIDQVLAMEQQLSSEKEMGLAKHLEVETIFCIKEGGVLAALWEMAELLGVGLELDLKEIPIRQEIIEVCEYFRLNPYRLACAGSLLMLTDDGRFLTEKLSGQGISAQVIGQITDSAERIFVGTGEKRHLGKPTRDEMYKVLGGGEWCDKYCTART